MKRIPYFIIASLIIIFTTACSSEKAKEEAAEEAVEELAENLLNKTGEGNVDIDIDQDGENAKMTIEGPDGQEITVDAGKEIPADFPEDVYLVKGEIESAGKMDSEEGGIYTVAIIPEKSFKEVVAEIKKEMTSKGWTSTMNMNMGDEAMQMYMKGESSVTVTITKEDGKTVAGYMVTSSK